MQTLETIVSAFPISSDEYSVLDQKFGKLAHYAAWQLQKKNSKNNHTNDPEDDVQELRIALMRAAAYYKRQTYIEDCFESLNQHVKGKLSKRIVKQLETLWNNRRHHGANKQVFGPFQEGILERMVDIHVPRANRPDRHRSLVVDSKFATYCKQIIWNAQKSLGKKITREKSWRSGLASLSEFDYLGVAV